MECLKYDAIWKFKCQKFCCTSSFLWCLLRMWQSKRSMIPMVRRHSQLKAKGWEFFSHPLYSTIYIPGGLQTTLQVCVSASSITLFLSRAHFSPLFLACKMTSLGLKMKSRTFKCWSFLVLFCLPHPHVAEQDVQAPQVPTSQSTGSKKRWKSHNIPDEWWKCQSID